jgi:thiamine biosynthesis lipoprotein
MGTRITVELYHEDPEVARRGVDAVLAEMRRIDNDMSPWIETSELARLNRLAAAKPLTVSDELFTLVKTSLHFSEITHGAFDITFASVGFLYDFRRGVRPDDTQRLRAARLINYHNLLLDENSHSIAYGEAGVRIDLGGIAKGHAVDRCIALLQAMGINQALVTAGGDSRIIGDRRGGGPWKIGVRDPRDDKRLVAVIPLENVAVSTSGVYLRFFDEDGVRYHHIIDPTSGDSARGMHSATIIGPDATTTDALSTSVFVLGVDRGLALINELPGVDAILVDAQGRLRYSDDLLPVKNPTARVKSPAVPTRQ